MPAVTTAVPCRIASMLYYVHNTAGTKKAWPSRSSSPPRRSPQPAPMPTGDTLAAKIADGDARLFWAAFEGCEPQALGDLLAPDYRMIHDKGGLADEPRRLRRTDGGAMRRPRAGRCQCEVQERRQLVPGSRTVRAMGGWGALEEASHIFFEWNAQAARWDMVGGARYAHVWQWMPAEGRFRLSESLSYDHAGAAPYPPPTAAK